LPAVRLLAASRHLAECPDCAARLLKHTGRASVPSLAADEDDGHLSYAQIEAYVDGQLPARDRAGIDAHIAACQHCAGDLAAVQPLAARIVVRVTWRERVSSWLRIPQIAMAASALAVSMVLIAPFLLIHHGSSQPAREAAAIPEELLPPNGIDLPLDDRDAVVSVLRGESHTSVVPDAVPDDGAIEQARRRDPNAHLLLGALCEQRGMWVEAEREYRLLLDANPRSKEARRLWENARKHAQAARTP
jgi:anti-sigma factor RsiW